MPFLPALTISCGCAPLWSGSSSTPPDPRSRLLTSRVDCRYGEKVVGDRSARADILRTSRRSHRRRYSRSIVTVAGDEEQVPGRVGGDPVAAHPDPAAAPFGVALYTMTWCSVVAL